MLSDFNKTFTHQFKIDNISESFTYYELRISSEKLEWDIINKFFDELKTIPARDSFELFLDINGNHCCISNCYTQSWENLKKHYDEYSVDSLFEMTLKITKKKSENVLSIYSIDSFSEFLNSKDFKNVLDQFVTVLDYSIRFEVFETIKSFHSKTIAFCSKGDLIPSCHYDSKKREQKFKLFDDNSYSSIRCKLLPCDFYLLDMSEFDTINQFFQKACAFLSLLYMSNSIEFDYKDTISFKINGYKSIKNEKVNIDDFSSNSETLFKIYEWSYGEGNCSDKLGLVRNLLTLHLGSDGKVIFDDIIWDAIQSNYQIYLRNNIQSYLEVKNKISEFVIDCTSRTYTLTDSLLGSLKANMFILLTFLLSTVVVNGLKDNGIKLVFSFEYFSVALLLALLSVLWLVKSNINLNARFNHMFNSIESILKLNYKNVLMENEIDTSITIIKDDNKKYFDSQTRKLYLLWWIILISFVLVYFILTILFQFPYILPHW